MLLRQSSNSLYRRIAAILARELNGRRPSLAPLPSEAEFGKRFGASRITIRHALALLEAQGLIFREQGRGTYLSPPKLVRHLHPLVTFEEDMLLQKAPVVTELVDFRRAVPPAWGRRVLQDCADSRSLRIVFRRFIDRLCVCYDERYLVREAANGLTRALLTDRSTREILRQTSGIQLTHLSHETEVVPVDQLIARAMGLTPGTLVLQNTYTSYAEGRPVEVGRAAYRADRFRFSFGQRQWMT